MKLHVALSALILFLVTFGGVQRLVSLQATDSPQLKADLAELTGTWTPVSMEEDGKLLDPKRLKKVKLTVDAAGNFTFDNGTSTHGGKYKLDPSKNPKTLDIVIEHGDEQGKVYLVIYKFENGRMLQCMQMDNKTRSTGFSGKAGTKASLRGLGKDQIETALREPPIR